MASCSSYEPKPIDCGVAAIYVLWGSTYLAVVVAVQSIPPFLLMGLRSLIAGALLFGFARFRSRVQISARNWAFAALGGLLLFVGCHGTLAYAQKQVPSGLAAVLLATIPFWIVLIKLLGPIDGRPKMMTLAALAPGLAGVALIAWPGKSDTIPIDPLMVVLLLGSAFSWAAGSLISQRESASVSAIALSGMQLLCGGAVLFAVSAVFGEPAGFSPGKVQLLSWAALGYLIIAGSLIAFTAYVWLLDHAAAPLVATYTFVNPVIAVTLGWFVLSEELTLRILAGFALVIGSVVAVSLIGERSRRSKPDMRVIECAAAERT